MDLEQLAKTVQWLDDERRKDRQEMTALQERLSALGAENQGLNRKIQQLETDLAAQASAAQRVGRIDEILGGYRKEMTRQLEELEQRRAAAEQEDDRLRKVERDGLNKSLSELRKSLEPVTRMERDLQSRKEEETRQSRLVAELQQKIIDFNRFVEERIRVIAVLEEGRRQDVKRITDLQSEQSELRRRVEDQRGKLEMVEDLARRVDVRLGELSVAENERRTLQSQWVDAQAIAQAARDRTLNEVLAKVEAASQAVEDFARRVEQYAEASREVRQSADNFRRMTESVERRITESSEIQRLGEERFRQDWAAFLADDQKRWTTHMLLRDEQWRDHDRLNTRQVERIDGLDEKLGEVLDTLGQMQTLDAQRLQALLKLVREMAAEHEQQLTQVR